MQSMLAVSKCVFLKRRVDVGYSSPLTDKKPGKVNKIATINKQPTSVKNDKAKVHPQGGADVQNELDVWPELKALDFLDPLAIMNCTEIGRSTNRKCVRFADEDEMIYEVKHRRNMTHQELSAAWYSREEYRTMNDACQTVIRLLERADQESQVQLPGGHGVRGLEGQTPKGVLTRQVATLQSIHAVRTEQERQERLFLDDPESIARVYAKCTAKSVEQALQRAAQDELDAADHASSRQLS